MTRKGPTHPQRGARRHGLPCRPGTHLPAAPVNIPRRTASPHLKARHSLGRKPERLSATAPCVPLRYALPGPLRIAPHPRPTPGRGIQRGGPQPAPLCRFKGVRGEIEIPPRFSLGGRGDILFSKENIPLGFSSRKPGLPFVGAKKMWGTFCTEKPCYPCTA